MSSVEGSTSRESSTVRNNSFSFDFECFEELSTEQDLGTQLSDKTFDKRKKVKCRICDCTLFDNSKTAHLKSLKHKKNSGAHDLSAASEISLYVSKFKDLSYCKDNRVRIDNELASIKSPGQKNTQEYLQNQSSIKDKTIYCYSCECEVSNTNHAKQVHFNSEKHKKNSGQSYRKRSEKFDREVAVAEIKLAGFIVYTRNSFLFSREFIPSLKNTFTDSQILNRVQLSNTKVTAVVVNVIAPAQKKRLTEILQPTKFSVLIDESTDITVNSSLCIVVRYPDPERQRVCESLWDLVPVYDLNDVTITATVENLFDKMMATFDNAQIARENIICFCSDTANVMMGEGDKSVFARLKYVLTNLTTLSKMYQ